MALGDQSACSDHPKQVMGNSILDVLVTYFWLSSLPAHCLNSSVLHKIFGCGHSSMELTRSKQPKKP